MTFYPQTMRARVAGHSVDAMPRRPPIDPQGYYHVGSRGSYGQLLFRTPDQYELFLRLYSRSAAKYGWETLPGS